MTKDIILSDILNIENLQDYKTHFAVYNGEHQPLDVFARNRNEWNGWSAYKGKKNDFNRKYIISFARSYTEVDTWLFGGIYQVLGVKNSAYNIKLEEIASCYIGRLKVRYKLLGRSPRVKLEGCYKNIIVSEILKEPYSGQAFVGYENIDLSYEQLEVIIKNDKSDWRGALQSIKGIYLVTDKKNGKKYVGSAYGEAGIWSRWLCYINTNGHGYNDELTTLLKTKGVKYARQNFKFTLLEYRPMKADNDLIIARECFWKDALLTRGKFGYNKN